MSYSWVFNRSRKIVACSRSCGPDPQTLDGAPRRFLLLLFLFNDSTDSGESQGQAHTESFRRGNLRRLDGDGKHIGTLKVDIRLVVQLLFAESDPCRSIATLERNPFPLKLFSERKRHFESRACAAGCSSDSL